LKRELHLSKIQENNIFSYEVNLKKILEDKYSFSFDLYISIYEMDYKNYFQIKNLIKTESQNEKPILHQLYSESFDYYFGNSNIYSFLNKNFTNKNYINNIFDYDFLKMENIQGDKNISFILNSLFENLKFYEKNKIEYEKKSIIIIIKLFYFLILIKIFRFKSFRSII